MYRNLWLKLQGVIELTTTFQIHNIIGIEKQLPSHEKAPTWSKRVTVKINNKG